MNHIYKPRLDLCTDRASSLNLVGEFGEGLDQVFELELGAPLLQDPGDYPSEDGPEDGLPHFGLEESQSTLLGPDFYKFASQIPNYGREFLSKAELSTLDGNRVEDLLRHNEFSSHQVLKFKLSS